MDARQCQHSRWYAVAAFDPLLERGHARLKIDPEASRNGPQHGAFVAGVAPKDGFAEADSFVLLLGIVQQTGQVPNFDLVLLFLL